MTRAECGTAKQKPQIKGHEQPDIIRPETEFLHQTVQVVFCLTKHVQHLHEGHVALFTGSCCVCFSVWWGKNSNNKNNAEGARARENQFSAPPHPPPTGSHEEAELPDRCSVRMNRHRLRQRTSSESDSLNTLPQYETAITQGQLTHQLQCCRSELL